jgi:hypothetical protein
LSKISRNSLWEKNNLTIICHKLLKEKERERDTGQEKNENEQTIIITTRVLLRMNQSNR